MKTNKLLVVLLVVLMALSFSVSVNAGASYLNELEDFLCQAHTICGKTYELTEAQKKVVSDYLFESNSGVTADDAGVALAKLKSAIATLNETGAKSLSEVSAEAKASALSNVQAAGSAVGVTVDFDSNTKVAKVTDRSGNVLGSAKVVNDTVVGAVAGSAKVLEGENQLYNVADAGELKFRIDVDYKYFEGGKVYMDNNLVDPSNYTSKSGSTIIMFKSAYAKTLSLGDHVLRVEFNNGQVATVNFKATHVTGGGPAPAGAAPATTAGTAFVYTGSNTNVAYIVVSLLAVAAVSIAFVKKVYVK